jgi:dTDP-4-amino-4,6-dideoxygalactose transaminase
MVNRWVEFVKNYSKDNKMSYTCAMCDIKTKGLYTPLKTIKQNAEEKRRMLINNYESELKQYENVYYETIFAFNVLEKRIPPSLVRNMKIAKTKYNQYKKELEELTGNKYPELTDEKTIKKEMKKNDKESIKTEMKNFDEEQETNYFNFDSIIKKKKKGVILD